jgi:hypothetical protein
MVDKKQYYSCQDWEATIHRITITNNYIECLITAQGSSLIAVIGQTTTGNWIVFPELDKGGSLSSLNDIFWNEEKLTYILDNKKDAITIAYGIQFINTYLNTEHHFK